MNIVRRITQHILRKSYQYKCNSFKQKHYKPQKLHMYTKKCFQIVLASSSIPRGKLNAEDDLRKAVEEGETAILDLMNRLQVLVIEVSEEYRNCLTKQTELIKKSTSTGLETWDELPQFRTLASELSNELNAYQVLLKIIGDMANNPTQLSLMVDDNGLIAILKKYKELEVLLQHQFEQNKLKEQELLEANIANILSGAKTK